MGLIVPDYRSEDADGVSPSEREFDRATELERHRRVFVRGTEDGDRYPQHSRPHREVTGRSGEEAVRDMGAGGGPGPNPRVQERACPKYCGLRPPHSAPGSTTSFLRGPGVLQPAVDDG